MLNFETRYNSTSSVEFNGISVLEIEQTEEKLTGHYNIAFEVNNGQLEKLYEKLRKIINFIHRDETFVFEIQNGKSKAIYFYNIDYNILEFIERDFAEEIKDNNPVQSIVEVGLALNNMSQLDQLKYQTNFQIFLGILLDEFQPIGDFDGLLICVHIGRIWNSSNKCSVTNSRKIF